MAWFGSRGAFGLSASMLLHATVLGAVVILPALTPSALPETTPTPGVMDVCLLAMPLSTPAPRGEPRLHRLSRAPRPPAPNRADLPPDAPSPSDITEIGGPPDDAQGAPGCVGCSLVGESVGNANGLPDATERAGVAGRPIPVGGVVQPPTKVRHVAPLYPDIAKAAHVQGVVILECVIGPYGRVTDVHVLRGHPLLDGPAVDAVRQWLYRPPRLNGQPIAVVMTVTVKFTILP
jgi:protein TonB